MPTVLYRLHHKALLCDGALGAECEFQEPKAQLAGANPTGVIHSHECAHIDRFFELNSHFVK